MNMMDPSGLLKRTGLGTNMTPQKRLDQIMAAEGHNNDKGYSLGNQPDYETFVAKRNKLSDQPQPTYEELLQEVWQLRRQVKILKQKVLEMGWQISGESMGR